MEQAEPKNELLDNLQKCRCCLRMLINDKKAVKVDETIRNHFFCLTQIELLLSENLSDRICQLCKIDLQTFYDLRRDLMAKQCSLYELAGINEQENYEDVDIQEEIIDYDMIETLSKEDYADEVYLEDVDEMESYIYEIDKESTSVEDVLKIEKIEENEEEKYDNDEGSEYMINYFVEPEDNSPSQNTYQDESFIEFEMCEICNVEVLKNHLNEHIDLMHVEGVSCDKCNECFTSKILLKKHINEEHIGNFKNRKSKKKLHYCSLCFKEYDYKKQLIDHIRSFHKKERNSQCSVCKRRFYHRDLKKHMQHVHGEKKISCEICGKLYTCVENLKLHLRYHEEPKHVCQYKNCGKKFHQKALWEHHMLKHKNERNISCTECNFLCYTPRDLKRHNQRVHNKVTRKCFGCDMVFHRKDKYREHVLKSQVHKDLTEESRNKILDKIKQLKWHEN